MKKYFHYTEKSPDLFLKGGMYSGSSYTDVGNYSIEETRTKCGIPKPAWVLEFVDDGGFKENRPFIVQPVPLRRFIGGAKDFIHPGRPMPISFRKL